MSMFKLTQHEIDAPFIGRNLPVANLYEEAIHHDATARLSGAGALVAYSGEKTGRSPKDKRIVKREPSSSDIWWGNVNVPMDPSSFAINRERAKDYLNTRDRLYCVDGFAGWDPAYRLKVRVICARPYHALFMHTMLMRPNKLELANYGTPDFVIYNAGEFPANRLTAGMTSKTSIDLSFEDKEMVILGTEYAGEMKKGVFTIMNYLMPKRGVLSMHCSATADKNTGSSSLLFGLSGTGKTTLSADPKRMLIGDDEHCWTDQGVFNIEGGCYAKTINLAPASEPDIFQALHFGAVLENVVLGDDREPDFNSSYFTENTRGAYPIEFIKNAKIPCVAGHPTDIIFLTCDAFGVLPPVSKLTPQQAMYHYISGYTAKVAGTEQGITDPTVTFSPCFGGPFLVWHPAKYAELLAEKMQKNKVNVWLVNTGWSGGSYGTGSRMKLAYTRAIIDAIHSGELANAPTQKDPTFGLHIVTACPGVPSTSLIPRNTWENPANYETTAKKLAGLFVKNFEQFAGGVSADVRAAGPAGVASTGAILMET
ncbi:MAG TPA: phosphoenolpyruvate carboxykinase (ATP) [Gemmatales bacterium]|nr:phosphoenolpyruvate carboxykinase (ATP) [Gemmatales bacterium]